MIFAPVTPAVSPAAPTRAEDTGGVLQGVARHVTIDGCQFVLTGPRPEAGMRLSCRLSAHASVTGTVRWIVEDRIGFAFQHPLDAANLAELASHAAQVKAIELAALPEMAEP